MKTTPARLAAAAGACLVAMLPTHTLAQCTTCPAGANVENEPQCAGPDIVNGGCNSNPPVFGTAVPGQPICGTSWFDGSIRDTDWYQFTLAAPTSVSVTGMSQFPHQVGFGQGPTCPIAQLYIGAFGNACEPVSMNVTLPAGTWWLFFAPQFGPNTPCGTPYVITLNVQPTGACCLPTGACQMLGPSGCSSAGGVFRGQNSLCGNCPQPAGAWGEQDDASDKISFAQNTMGTGALSTISGQVSGGTDADIYAIRICSPSSFSAETRTGPGTLSDTQLFLFRSDGIGITFNDDDPAGSSTRSRLSSTFTSSLPVGVYYLAISAFDSDPVNSSAAEIWADTPYGVERAPDGAGGALAGWNGSGPGGDYTIRLTGSCYAVPPGWTEEGDARNTTATAQNTLGSGPLAAITGSFAAASDTDMYAVNLCNPASFSAETVTGPTFIGDTQLFLFRPTGIGITFNDDDPLGGGTFSRLSSTFTSSLPVGRYYLAISEYDADPVNASNQELWFDTPYTVERAPDGPGAATPMNAWNGSTATPGSYVIRLAGACYSGVNCYPNCDGSTGNPLLTANDFQCFIDAFAGGQTYANCDGSTGTPALTANDFQCFINKFAGGCS